MVSSTDARTAIQVSAPVATLVLVLANGIWGSSRKPPAEEGGEQPRRALVRRVALRTLIGLFVAQGILEGITTPAKEASWPIFFVTGEVIVWAAVLLLHAIHTDLMLWTVALATAAFEVPLVVLRPFGELVHDDGFEIAKLSMQAACLAVLLYLVIDSSVGLAASSSSRPAGSDTEAEPLLRPNDDAAATPDYGGTTASAENGTGADKNDSAEDRLQKRRQQRLKETGGWLPYLKDFSIFLPIIDPRREPSVILCLLVVVACLVASRFLVVLVPRQLGVVTDRLLAGEAPYRELAKWLLLSWVDSSAGVDLIESLAAMPVRMFAARQLTNAAFRQVMSLSMDFHSDRNSGEIIRAIDQGSAISHLFEWLVTEVGPSLADLGVAMVLLHRKFNIYLPVAILVAAASFFTLELWLASNNLENRRNTTKLDREATRKMHQAVQNWPTVAYFNMFAYEGDQYATATLDRQAASRRWYIRSLANSAIIRAVVPLTFFVLAALAINEVVHGRSTTGDFVFLVQYWDNIIWPLRSLSSRMKYMMQDLTDAERLLELFQTKPSIANKPGAVALPRAKGSVRFDDVEFAYDQRKPTLTGINIDARPGQTIALVGATGAGKSSIIKLLHRFYDVTRGSVTIDGHDIRDVTVESLRESLGVVPQDPMLFNATIMENLRYARPEATDDEVHAACRAAAIHDKIMTFSDQYETKVGENGVKLSGGEAQRVAIARVFLKNPPILILDEATSKIDTATEALIQESLEKLKKERTSFVIAHRLSTIVDADIIMVIDDGRIVERGDHDALLQLEGGKYRALWELQARGAKRKTKQEEDVTVDDLIEMGKEDGNKTGESAAEGADGDKK